MKSKDYRDKKDTLKIKNTNASKAHMPKATIHTEELSFDKTPVEEQLNAELLNISII